MIYNAYVCAVCPVTRESHRTRCLWKILGKFVPVQCFAWTSMPLKTQGDIRKFEGENAKWDTSAAKMFSMNTMTCLFA